MDHGTFEWLTRVEAKLDYLISRLPPEAKKPAAPSIAKKAAETGEGQ